MRNNPGTIQPDRFGLLEAFSVAAQRLSFVDAAKALNIPPSTLGRRIKKLEQELGVQLFVRTTREIALTAAGKTYNEHTSKLLLALHEADLAVDLLNQKPSGVLKINAPVSFGRICIAPLLNQFMRQYPQLKIELSLTDQYVDLVREQIDIAIRIGTLDDSTLRARLLCQNKRQLVASPAYLKTAGTPLIPADLINHRCLHFSPLRTGHQWILLQGGQRTTVTVTPHFSCDDAGILLDAAKHGMGIALLADFLTQPALKNGELVPVLADWALPASAIYAIYADTQFLAQKSRLFIDFLVDNMSASV
ncbi:LysR family transcriptional regulator [Rheinheimera sp. EpRS3]|uniref:LysR family transcriptional regulator n=1 Tax=Rheinheimera sp. EpRS3 TaxID=1712383 RepID=UPI00074A3801|nr:LysR family transcriptional regulator [Rheinheimera sp. EpRS3]KUM55041.1 hypothetical protein AR688_17515 [Rheinheimera sp. EpRS3]